MNRRRLYNGITARPRDDRRHSQDDDIARLATSVTSVLNFEMGVRGELVELTDELTRSRRRDGRVRLVVDGPETTVENWQAPTSTRLMINFFSCFSLTGTVVT